MKPLLLKILKVFLIVAAALLVLALVFGIVLSLDWPWWVGFFVLLGLLGLAIGIMFLKKILLKRREQRFVDGIIEQDDAYIQSMKAKDQQRSNELQARWKEAMDALRGSHLRKQGNPLYVLPWYLVIGESGSGKTTAIKSAHLSSPFADVVRTSGISGTRNCDWWFFEQAILIDTAGRYAIPVDEGKDKEEWQNFLALLVKYRKKEPLNGLVVTVAADKLLESGAEVLEQDARSIRHRIDELMRVLGAKFPVYVLVTKCDLIQGMTQFCDNLPEKGLDQAMGLINNDVSKDFAAFQTRAMGVLADRLRDLRLLLLHQEKSSGSVDPGLLLFPEEFERLKSGLSAFIKGAFQENPYQETPLFRGLFFTSGRQEGSPYSHFLKALGLIQERDVLPGTNKGLFLHDVFGRILPKDRELFAPTQRAIEWSKLTRNLGLTSWVAVAIALCGLLSFSFVKNLRTLRVVSREFSKPPVLQGEVVSDVVTMDQFRGAILKVEDQNKHWWIPRFGLNESKNVEARLKDKFCEQFKGGFLVPFDKEMARGMAHFSSATPDIMLGNHVAHLVRRINLLRARLEKEPVEKLYNMPQPSYTPIISVAEQNLAPEIQEKFGNQYLSYLQWRSDEASLNQEMNALQTWLKHILTLKGSNLHWVVSWLNQEGSLPPTRLEDFWGGSLQGSEEVEVAPAFTVRGKEKTDAFITEIESALVDPLIIASKKLEFRGWYRKAYLDAWYGFAEGFPTGAQRLQGKEERQQVAARMTTGAGPYFSMIDTMGSQLTPVVDAKDLPAWVALVYEFESTKAKAAQEATLKNKGALIKATKKGQSLISKLGKKLSRLDAQKKVQSELLAARAFAEYQGALSQMAPIAASRAMAQEMTAQVFKEDPASGQNPFFKAQNGLNKLKTYLGGGKSGQKVFWGLAGGPLDYLWYFARMETACYIQARWEEQVLVELQGLADQRAINSVLLGKDGLATKFVEGPAGPFLSRSLKRGYYGKKVFGQAIPFSPSFLSFMTKGAKRSRPVKASYAVSIRGLPTDTNKGAKLRAHATRLEVQCGDETRTLVNLNYPVGKTFDWSPQDCGDVIFEIEVGKLVLTKRYVGVQGFPEFLQDFKNGQHRFHPSDFPKEQAALKRLKIKSIKAKYRFKGHKPVLKLLGTAPGHVPRAIVTCWDQ